jgi:hypothetical protein
MPAQYQATNDLLQRLHVHISYVDKSWVQGTAPFSFSFKAVRGVYGIYIDRGAGEETFMVRDLHEKGHILFNHFSRPRTHRQQFEEFFRRNLHTILSSLPPERNINMRLGLYSSYLYNRFSDAAQAMEINTKLFKEDSEAAAAFWFPGEPKKSPFILPTPGWPWGLDWMSYMGFLCAELKFSLYMMAGGGEGKIRSGDVTAYNSGRSAQERIIELHEAPQESAGKIENETGIIRRGRTADGSGAGMLYRITECAGVKDLARILRERGRYLKRTRLVTDLMYHRNRNKFGGNGETIVPRRYRRETYIPRRLCVLLDVSGSVPAGFVKNVVRTVAGSSGYFNPRDSRLICWSDRLCSDTFLGDIKTAPSGGGTALGGGIEYCKRYLNRDSVFFIISDFQDELNDWIKAAGDIRCEKTALGYGRISREKTLEEWFSAAGSNGNYRKNPVDIKTIASVFNTVLIRESGAARN